MSDIFTSLAVYVGNFVGGQVIGGYILGIAVTVVLLIGISWALDNHESTVIIVASGIGIAFSTMVGWFDIWVVFFIVIILAYLLVRPLGGDD